MYIGRKQDITSLNVNEGYEGESIEKKVKRIMNNKEPIKDGAPLIFTERKEGVKPGYDVRTDRFEVALDAMDKVAKAEAAKREAKAEMPKGDDGGAESTQA